MSFFIGIARNLIREYWELAPTLTASLDDLSDAEHPWEDPAESTRREDDLDRSEAEFQCLEHCLEGVAPESRDLIVSHYVGEKGLKINNRKRLAGELNVSPANLRLRAFRVREKLESCVRRCLEGFSSKRNSVSTN